MPHPPQLDLSEYGSTHVTTPAFWQHKLDDELGVDMPPASPAPPSLTVEESHWPSRQVPFMQAAPFGQALPQLPQFWPSVCVFTQVLPHSR
jgi:hypothetical protein